MNKLTKALKAGNKIIACGNGGSASQADHLVGELVGRFEHERKSLSAISLSNVNIITAIANDYGYDKVFSRQIEGLGNKGDVLITFSTSGRSKNILEAIKQAKKQGIHVLRAPIILGLTTAQVQEQHLSWLHFIAREVELAFI